ncbi:MAG: methyltransferase domain-containing protein [Jatrophihabitans sp.]
MTTHALGWDELFRADAGQSSGVAFMTVVHALANQAETVLDVGCGRGWWASDGVYRPFLDLRGPGRTIIGIDVDDDGEDNGNLDEFRRIGAGGRWPVADASVDVAVSDWVLEHVEDPRAFVDELTRVLRPGGVVVARSVSRHSLLSLAARAVPNARHATVLARVQPGRDVADIFPTSYRMNTEKALAKLFGADYEWSVRHMVGLHQYFGPWPRLARAISATEPRLPKALQMTLILCARKRGSTSETTRHTAP